MEEKEKKKHVLRYGELVLKGLTKKSIDEEKEIEHIRKILGVPHEEIVNEFKELMSYT